MEKSAKILVTGSAGMVGKALVEQLQAEGYSNVIPMTRQDCDLEDFIAVKAYFAATQPKYVLHIAAKVGGIKANMSNPVSFLESNLLSQTHMIKASYLYGVKKFLFLGSSCIYPRECPQPMKEEYLMRGPLEPTNEGYALAKIAGIKLCQAYSKQYNFNTVCPMPCNIYGPGDSFDLNHSHVLSALVKRFIDAKCQGADSVTLWGTGSAKREFIHINDVVAGIVFVMENVNTSDIINLGVGTDISIKDLAEKVARFTEFQGEIRWDHSKPDGMPRKCLDMSRMQKLGFSTKVSFDDGIRSVIEAYNQLLNEKG